MKIEALLDSNVLIALVAETHEHHKSSSLLLDDGRTWRLAVAAHSYAEAYSTLTRRSDSSPFRFDPDEAFAAVESLRRATELMSLTAARSFDAIREFARHGGVGPLLYDKMIGEVAVVHNVGTILTWNVSPMRGLFPQLEVTTPDAFLKSRRITQ